MPTKTVSINTSAKAILKNGSAISRADVLTRLGLNPTTPPDAWLAIVACGSNASALDVKDASILLRRGTITRRSLDAALLSKVDRLGGG